MRIATIVLLAVLTGCMGGLPVKDFAKMLDSPAVQATLEKWAGRSDITNPTVGFYFVTGGEVRLTGVIIRGEMEGSRAGGIDAARLGGLITATRPAQP